MESGDILTTIAEVAIAIAGFSSVIVALSPTPIRDWRPVDRFVFRVLLQVAAITVLFALLPLVIYRAFPGDAAWRVALFLYGVVHLADVSSFLFRFPEHLPIIPKITSVIGFAIAISQMIIAVFGPINLVEFIYLACLLWHLGISFMGFAMLVYGARSRTDT